MTQLIHILEFDNAEIDTITLYDLINDKRQFNEILSHFEITLDLSSNKINLGSMPLIDKERLRSAITMYFKEVQSQKHIDLTLISTIMQFSPQLQHQLVAQAYEYLVQYDKLVELEQASRITCTHIANVRPQAKETLVAEFVGLNDNRLPLAIYEKGFILETFYVPVIRIEPAVENELTSPLTFTEADDEKDNESDIPVIMYND